MVSLATGFASVYIKVEVCVELPNLRKGKDDKHLFTEYLVLMGKNLMRQGFVP